ncbi:hypothetical protein [Roseobacter sp. A03A-229]
MSLTTKISACVALFGKSSSTHEVSLKVSVYKKLLELRNVEGIDEFDLRVALEDVDSFRSLDDLVAIANSFKIIHRDSKSDFIEIREEIPFDDLFSSEIPSDPSSFSTEIFDEVNQDHVNAYNTDVFQVLGVLEKSRQLAVEVASQGIGDPVFFSPFVRVGEKSGNVVPFSDISASSSFLDTILFLNTLSSCVPRASRGEELLLLLSHLKRISDYLLSDDDEFGDVGVLCLKEDDDYPGADRPATMPCGMLLSVFAIAAKAQPDLDFTKQVSDHVDHLNRQMEDDGGWGVYGYKSGLFGDLKIASQKHVYFSYHAARGLIACFSLLKSDEQKRETVHSLRKLAKLLNRSFKGTANESQGGWCSGFNPDSDICPFDTATSIVLSLMLADFLQDEASTLRLNAAKAVDYISSQWSIGSLASEDLHRITFRPPTSLGPSGTSLSWEQSGRSKILDALATSYLVTENDLSTAGWELMSALTDRLLQENLHGHWPDLNSDMSEVGGETFIVANNNNTMMSASALAKSVASFAKRSGHIDTIVL